MQALISRGITRLIRTGSNLVKRDAPALPTFPETDRLFFLSPHLLMDHLQQGGLTHPYKDHVWVYSCVNAIAQNLTGIPLLFFTGSRKELWTFRPNRFKEVVDKDTGLIAGWTYKKGGKKIPFEAHEIISSATSTLTTTTGVWRPCRRPRLESTKSNRKIKGAMRLSPEGIASWGPLLPKNRKIVLYCS